MMAEDGVVRCVKAKPGGADVGMFSHGEALTRPERRPWASRAEGSSLQGNHQGDRREQAEHHADAGSAGATAKPRRRGPTWVATDADVFVEKRAGASLLLRA